jgi:hypothetical protein
VLEADLLSTLRVPFNVQKFKVQSRNRAHPVHNDGTR